jgi:SEC-C motif
MNEVTEAVHRRIEQLAALRLDEVDRMPHFPLYGAGKVLTKEASEYAKMARVNDIMGQRMQEMLANADPDDKTRNPTDDTLTLSQFDGSRENMLMMAVLYDVMFEPTRTPLQKCPHLAQNWKIMQREMTMVEGGLLRLWCCKECVTTRLWAEVERRREELTNDKHCDVCLQIATHFTAHVGYLRTVMITFHIGDCCKPLMTYREPMRQWYKAPRNEPCPCGSGRKFKHCHGAPGA